MTIAMKNVLAKPIQKRQKQLSLFKPIAMEFGPFAPLPKF